MVALNNRIAKFYQESSVEIVQERKSNSVVVSAIIAGLVGLLIGTSGGYLVGYQTTVNNSVVESRMSPGTAERLRLRTENNELKRLVAK